MGSVISGKEGRQRRTFSTDRELKALKPEGAWYDVWDHKEGNHAVRIGPKNSRGTFKRTFVMVARFPGSTAPARRSIGEYGAELSLECSREKVRQWRTLIKNQIDPREAKGREAEWCELIRKGQDPRQVEAEQAQRREEDERQRKASAENTFSKVAEDFLKRHVKGQRQAKDTENLIRRELVSRWGDRPIDSITRREVIAMVEEIVDRGAPAMARNVLAWCKKLFKWAVARDLLENSPAAIVDAGELIGPKNIRKRVLNDQEIFALWRASGRLAYPFGPLYRLLLLTGTRKTEASGARWREVSMEPRDKALWTVPAERFKMDATHLVPLTGEALAVLDCLPRFVRGDHLFSTTFGKVPVSGFSKSKARLDRHMLRTLKAMARKRGEDPSKVTLPPFVVHDLRRTVRTRLSELKVPDVVAENVIGHGRKGIQRVYDQHSYLSEMRQALELWAGKIRDITEPPPQNVVKLGDRAAS